jgi:protein-disulfide isomerase
MRRGLPTLLFALLLSGAAILLPCSCAPNPTASAAPPPRVAAPDPGKPAASAEPASLAEPDGNEIVAEMDGLTITRKELDARIVGDLARLRQEEYDLRRGAIDDLVKEELTQREAAARGISAEALFDAEVRKKAKEVTSADVEAFYEANKDRVRGQAKAMVVPQIRHMLEQDATDARAREFQRELEARARLRVLLEPPRVDIPIPAMAPSLGPADAKVTIVEFTDYQCPFCHRAQQTVERLLDRYQGRIRLVYRDLPLDMHTRAFAAARATRCANEQNRFWDLHRNLLENPGSFSDDDFKERAKELGLDGEQFAACLDSPRHDPAIQASLDEAVRIGIRATPTFLINGRMISGARPFDDFADVIEEELRAGS